VKRIEKLLIIRKIRRSIKLVSIMFVLFCFLSPNVVGSKYYAALISNSVTIASPSVILQNGTTGTTTIYANNTSAKVSVSAPRNNTEDYVDNNTSNVDSSAGKGTHSNFTAQKYDPDSVYDTITEQNTSVTIRNWGITSSSFTTTSTYTNYRYMGGMSPSLDNMTVTKLYVRYSGTGTVAIALYTGGTLTDPTGATKRTETYNVAVSTGWNAIDVPDYSLPKNTVTWIGLAHGGGSTYYSTNSADSGDFQSANGRWSQTTPSNADETAPMPNNPGAGSFGNFWYAFYAEYKVPNYEVDLEVQWTNIDYDETYEELAIYADKVNAYSLDATGGYMTIGDGTPDWGSTTGTISFWVKMDNSVQGRFWGQNDMMETRWSVTYLLLDWGATGSMTSAYSFSANKWYFVAIVWDENNNNLFLYVGDRDNLPALDSNSLSGTWTGTTPTPTGNRFLNGLGASEPVDGHGDDLRYWNIARTLAQIQSDYNTELTGTEPNLRSYFKLNNNFDDIGPNNNDGSGSGSYSFSSDVPFPENIRVDVWNGASWQNLLTNLVNGWNNVSVSSYLTSSNFTIMFKGNNETNDYSKDKWYIDAALLHVWTFFPATYDYVLKVNNTDPYSWQMRLKKYSDSNINRIKNSTIYFHNSTDGASTQISIQNGAYTQDTGSWYNLNSLTTIYIAVKLEANATGTTRVYVFLEILKPNTTTYARYIITFEFT